MAGGGEEERRKRASSLLERMRQQQREEKEGHECECLLVLDGGLATQLEALGADIRDPLWSAVCLVSNPNLIKQVHLQYLEAGADILVTSSYQASLPGFSTKGLSSEEAELLLQRSVELALEARDAFWEATDMTPTNNYSRALVAASVGSYGAYLADGSEYTGYYGEDITSTELKEFHRRRLQVLVHAGPDLLAFETIPNKIEAEAIVELLDEENVQIPSWICFSSVDGEHASSGEDFEECLQVVNKSEKVAIVGINCCPPQFIESLVCRFWKLTKKLIAVYPNNGEIYDASSKMWLPSECYGDENFGELAKRWHECGANLIGGCCRTTPSTIRSISKALKGC